MSKRNVYECGIPGCDAHVVAGLGDLTGWEEEKILPLRARVEKLKIKAVTLHTCPNHARHRGTE